MKPRVTVYRTLVLGGWKNSVCCKSVPVRWNDDAYYCACEEAKTIHENNPSLDDGNPKSIDIPEYRKPIEEYQDAPTAKQRVPFAKKSDDGSKGSLPW